MKTFVEYLKEHPTITQRIAKKINPAEVIRDKLKSARGATKRNLKKSLDKVSLIKTVYNYKKFNLNSSSLLEYIKTFDKKCLHHNHQNYPFEV